jgi:hypothetical protein
MNRLPPLWVLLLALCHLCADPVFAQDKEAGQSRFQEKVQPVLEQYCFRCHGPEKKKSGVRVDIIDGSLGDKQLFLLKHVLKQLEEGAMPPEKQPQPTAEERKVVLEWVSRTLLAGERKVRARNGSIRRLTVEQYHNTLRDLLGIEDLLAKALPADGVSKEGFRNNQDTLLLMPQMMETYFEIAEKALDLCLVDETKKPRIQCFRVELGKGVNKHPTADKLVLNGPNLLPKENFLIRQVVPDKPFPFEPFAMRTKFRFFEGYAGNGTVRAWRNFEGIYHNVFAALNGKFTGGLNYGRSYVFVPEGLLLRPRSPETENGNPPAQGPSPTFAMPLRELPRSGLFQLTVEAARYEDGFQPDTVSAEANNRLTVDVTGGQGASLEIPAKGVYQLDVVLEGQPRDDVMTADIGQRTFSRRLKGKFTKVSESAGAVAVKSLPGIVIDDPAADKAGDWTDSVHGKPYLGKGYIHDGNTSKGVKLVTFNVKLPRTGNYQVNLAYTYGNNRSPAVPVDIHHADGVESAKVNQMKQPPIGGLFIPLGSFRFEKEKPAIVVISNKDTRGVVIVDGLQFIEEEAAKKQKAENTARLKEGEVIIPFLVARFAKGTSPIKIGNGDGKNLRRVHVTPVSSESESGRQFAAFEKRTPTVSAHIGVRTDVGPRFTRVNQLRAVPSATVERYSFRAPISSFPSPETEEGNANYLAGLWEIAIRSEPSGERQVPRLLLSAVEFEGPFHETWPPRGHRDIFFAPEHRENPPAYAREVLERFAARAFRRPVTPKELKSLVGVWQKSYARSQDFQESVRDALLVILTSPQFLFLVEESAGPQAEPLSPYELASKLSYFLWNTTPDEKLNSLAENNKLRASLPAEVDRLVADQRFTQFTDEFVSQWLSLDKFDVVNINHGTFPRLSRETRRELRKEPVRFVTHLLRANLPLRSLIDSDFIVANEVVEDYYGIAASAAQGFDFIPVRHESKTLGGVLTQAAILSGLSDGHESNPVKRGAWLARKIIAEPPKPPPPNVPDLEKETKGNTLRERLEQHRNQEGCAQCHQKIDPWGLPFEAFDAAGLLKGGEVDTGSTLPDNTEVADANALKQYLSVDRIDQVAFSFLKHLASYGIGRSLTFNELEYLKNQGEKTLKAGGYRMKDCIRFVIESPMFMEK